MRYLVLCTALALPVYAVAQPIEPIPVAAIDASPSDAQPSEAPSLPDVVEPIRPGQEVDWVVSTITAAKNALNENLYGPFVSIIIMALLSIFSFLFVRSKELRRRLHPYMGEVALILSVLGYVALGLNTLPVGADLGAWWGVIGPGLKTGLAAVGGYEILVKRLWKHWGPKLWSLVRGIFKGKKKDGDS